MTKTHNVIFLIDIQNGFAMDGLSLAMGGSLYVPGGEKVGQPVADLFARLSDTTFILSQDYHPENHISFAMNHKGMLPFMNIYLQSGCDGAYRAVGADGNGKICAVDTDERGYITAVRDEEAAPALLQGAIRQTLWLPHCIQGTNSTLFVDEIMDQLPPDLYAQVVSHGDDPLLSARDERGNHFHVVRKGMKSDLDSYGIATENDGVSKTSAPDLFKEIAARLKADGVEKVNIGIGGLATNFCVEYSHADIYREFIPALKAAGIDAEVKLLTDISEGIPYELDDKSAPSLSTAYDRMMAMGTTLAMTVDFYRPGLRTAVHNPGGPGV